MTPSYQVSLYLKGDSLSPIDLTEILGVVPTRAHSMGDKRLLVSGKEVKRRTGLWVLTMRDDHAEDFSALMRSLMDKFSACDQSLATLPGVEEAFVDVLVMRPANDGGGGTNEFWMDGDILNSLGKLGLPLQVTATIIPE